MINYLIAMATFGAIYAILALGLNVMWGMAGMVNLGIVGFAIVVVFFYFSDIFDKIGRSLGLVGLGILFLAGGWILERARRGLIASMNSPKITLAEESQ